MEIIEVKCTNCGKELYIQEDHVREKMFCTLGCMDSFSGVYVQAARNKIPDVIEANPPGSGVATSARCQSL